MAQDWHSDCDTITLDKIDDIKFDWDDLVDDTFSISTKLDPIIVDDCEYWPAHDDTVTVTVANDAMDFSTLDDIMWNTNHTVKVGDFELTPDLVAKMSAIVDMIEGLDSNNELRQIFETQLTMNKIRGNDGDT